MDDERGYDGGSEASPTSSQSEISLAERKKPCEICGSDANEDKIMTCYMCKDTRVHIYCARVMKRSVPRKWICNECSPSYRIAKKSRTTYQVNSEVVHHNMTTSTASNQISTTHQPSQAHASPQVEEASPPVPMDTCPVKLPDSNLPSDTESAI